MSRVRDLTPEAAEALTDRYGEYEWWADREVSTVRARWPKPRWVPEGVTEQLVRLTYEQE